MLNGADATKSGLGENTDPIAELLALGRAVRGHNDASLVPVHETHGPRDQLLRGGVHSTEKTKIIFLVEKITSHVGLSI